MALSHGKQTQSARQCGCDWAIERLPGLSAEYGRQLERRGIETTLQLLHRTRSQPARQELAHALRAPRQEIDKWVAMADLARLPGVGCQYCGLLLHAGIASVGQLAQTPVRRLHQQILRLQVATMHRRDLCPSPAELQDWIAQARHLQH
ncbi:hypothetical protein KR51_00007380 [Rubidibacter lacunae KORDI 51-2]|uniref:DUF4332 domain-containing protein n=1 Tax=Rubidibacter lacunae KORDI 51-2 TaxID=582515 RepID=U5DSD1_9CHRO|nr:DUF4332 domain-containing protein [Rubidibacter lacunae]ERN42580.1 hypothetical protein KR51_00007380 [Rubidibacter lacunae KORDI 51-2]